MFQSLNIRKDMNARNIDIRIMQYFAESNFTTSPYNKDNIFL